MGLEMAKKQSSSQPSFSPFLGWNDGEWTMTETLVTTWWMFSHDMTESHWTGRPFWRTRGMSLARDQPPLVPGGFYIFRPFCDGLWHKTRFTGTEVPNSGPHWTNFLIALKSSLWRISNYLCYGFDGFKKDAVTVLKYWETGNMMVWTAVQCGPCVISYLLLQ